MPEQPTGATEAPNIVLTGFMGTGKTTTGRLLAERLDRRFVDTDQIIEERHGSIASIFADSGEERFREIEREVAAELGATTGLVISTGGRMLLDPANERSLSANGVVVCLHAPAEVIVERVLSDAQGAVRPLLTGPDPAGAITTLVAERAEGYGRFAQVDTDGREPAEVADTIVERLPGWSTTSVRLATLADVERVATVLSDAFADYAWTDWAVPADGHRQRLRALYEIHSMIGVHRGDLWLLEAGGQIVAAAAWSLLDGGAGSRASYEGVPADLLERARAELPPLFGDRLALVQAAEDATLGARPTTPYWFLDCVGTDPVHQGRGFAQQLVAAVLDHIDTDGLPTSVETSTERNVEFYQRLGFAIVQRSDLGDEVPPVWVMTRPAPGR